MPIRKDLDILEFFKDRKSPSLLSELQKALGIETDEELKALEEALSRLSNRQLVYPFIY
jgi:hypothetical protein